MKIAVYTFAPWNHPLAVQRIVSPAGRAGVELINGNLGHRYSDEIVDQADIVLIQRDFPALLPVYERVVQKARAQAKPIVYELDDLLFALPADHPHRGSRYYSKALIPIFRALTEADGVIASTPSLAAEVSALNPQTQVLPTYLDDEIWKFPDQGRAGRTPDQRVTIGYMGGGSHTPDLEMLLPVLLNLLDRFGQNLSLEFYGEDPPGALVNHPRVRLVSPNFDYHAHVRTMTQSSCDIWIAPLIDNRFNRCKSWNKFLEYSILGLAGVYGRTAPYEAVVTHGENGFLAASPQEWEQCLTAVIENPALRWAVGQKARETVEAKWLLKDHAGEWGDGIASIEIARRRSPLEPFLAEIAHQLHEFHESVAPDPQPARPSRLRRAFNRLLRFALRRAG